MGNLAAGAAGEYNALSVLSMFAITVAARTNDARVAQLDRTSVYGTEVIASWPRLPEAVEAGILVLARTTSK